MGRRGCSSKRAARPAIQRTLVLLQQLLLLLLPPRLHAMPFCGWSS
jgi:hypothetical protein